MKSKKEKILTIAYICFGKYLPVSYHMKSAKKIRVFFARKILKKAGKNINIERGAVFNGNCILGNNSNIGVNCELNGAVEIGNDVMMGPEVVIYTRNHSHSGKKPMNQQGYEEEKKVIIGNDVWIGRRVIILPGVIIPNGCVIGAGAIVTKNFPEYSIIGGNPAKVIGKREELNDA